MLQPFINSMALILVAKFILNDIPHILEQSETKVPEERWKMLGGISYHYSAIKASWMHDDKKWSLLMGWARQQLDFWWNHMSGPLEMIAFTVEAAGLRSFCSKNGISHSNFKIYISPQFGPY